MEGAGAGRHEGRRRILRRVGRLLGGKDGVGESGGGRRWGDGFGEWFASLRSYVAEVNATNLGKMYFSDTFPQFLYSSRYNIAHAISELVRVNLDSLLIVTLTVLSPTFNNQPLDINPRPSSFPSILASSSSLNHASLPPHVDPIINSYNNVRIRS